jgi:maleate cis-trans isomerase
VPVLSSNQSMVWHLLRSSGIDGRIENYGRLFAD